MAPQSPARTDQKIHQLFDRVFNPTLVALVAYSSLKMVRLSRAAWRRVRAARRRVKARRQGWWVRWYVGLVRAPPRWKGIALTRAEKDAIVEWLLGFRLVGSIHVDPRIAFNP